MEEGSGVPVRDRCEPARGGPGRGDVAAARRELGLRVEQGSETELADRRSLLGRDVEGVLDRIGDHRCCDLWVAAGGAHEREAGLWRPGVLMRFEERRLGAGDVAASQADVAELDEWPAELAPHPGTKFRAGRERLRLGGIARPRHAQDLGAMDAAPPVDAAEGRTVSPALHDLGPVRCHVVACQPLRRADQLAVHHSGRQGVCAARHQQRPDLLELGETCVDVAVVDLHTGLGDAADDHGRLYPGLLAELDRPSRLLERRLEIAAHEALVGAGHGDQCVSRGVGVAGEQSFGSAQPAAHRCHQACVHHQVHRGHRCRPRRHHLVAVVAFEGMQGLPGLDRTLELTASIRRSGAELQRGGLCARREVVPDRVQEVACPAPVAALDRLLDIGQDLAGGRIRRAHCHSVTRDVAPEGCRTVPGATGSPIPG